MAGTFLGAFASFSGDEDLNRMPLTLLLVTVTWPPVKGGAENYLFEIYRRLPGVNLLVLTSQQPGDSEFDIGQPWQTIRVPVEWFSYYWGGRRKRLTLLVKLHKVIQNHKIDLVVTGFAFPDGLIAWLLKRVYNFPYITHFYGVDFLGHLSNPLWRKLIFQIFQDADCLIGCSSYSRDKVVEMGIGPNKTHVVLPGVDADRFYPVTQNKKCQIRQELDLPEDALILLTVSRLVARKSHDSVLMALPRILAHYPQLLYVIVGQGKQKEMLQAIVEENNLVDNVVFVGEVVDRELPLYYQASDLFVMPNREIKGDVEGFGIVFIEASASGIPVIGGESGGTKDAIEHGESGLLLSPDDVKGIASSIIQLLSDRSLMSKMGIQGREMVENKFSWEKAADQVETLVQATWQFGVSQRHDRVQVAINAMREIARPCGVE